MVVLESLLGEPTSIPCENLKSAVAEMKRNNTLFDNWIKLDKVAWKDDYLKCADNKPSDEDLNRKENRNKIVSGIKIIERNIINPLNVNFCFRYQGSCVPIKVSLIRCKFRLHQCSFCGRF